MKKEFLLNIVFLLAINFLIKPLYLFGIDLRVQNLVGLTDFGMYKVLFNIAFLLQFIHEPGIQSFNSQNIAKHPEKLGHHLPRILGLKAMLFIVYFALSIGYFLLKGFDDSLMPLMVIVTINLFLSALFLYLRTNIAAIGKFRVDSLLSSLDKVLMLIIIGYLAWAPSFYERFEIIWLAYGQMAAFGISCVVALLILYRHIGSLKITISLPYINRLLWQAAPYALILLTISAYTRIDSIMLEHILDDRGRESGIYEYAYRFLDALNMIGYLFAALLLPMYAANIANKRTITDLIDIGLRMMVLVTFVGAAAMITYRTEVMTWAHAEATKYYSDIMLYLMLSFVSLSIAYIFGSLLVAANHLRKLNLILIAGVIINVGLNLYLIPREMALGAAKATLITQTLMTIGQIYIVISDLKVKIDRRLLLIVMVFGLLCAALFFGVRTYILMPWLFQAVASICISLVLALLLRLIDPKMIIDLVSKKSQLNKSDI